MDHREKNNPASLQISTIGAIKGFSDGVNLGMQNQLDGKKKKSNQVLLLH